MRKKTFAEIRRHAPSIVVSRGRTKCILYPEKWDAQYEYWWSSDFIKGSGSREYPYIYMRATAISQHHEVVYLWFKFRRRKQPVFIKVNDWVLRVEQAGVRAANNQFTRLLPK